MVSKAFERSINIFRGISFVSILFIILSINSSAACSVLCFGLNPYWLSNKSLFFSKYEDNWRAIIFSSTFEIAGRRKLAYNFQIKMGHPS